MRILGIDPGLSGGIALIDQKEGKVSAVKTPIYTYKKPNTRSNKKYLDMFSIVKLLIDWNPDHAFIEKQQPYPKQGLTSTFITGLGYGIYLGLIVCRGIPYTEVSPTVWKKALGVSADKDEARKRASELMPNASHLWQYKNEDGVAEAALLAYYGIQHGSATAKILN
ncbi:MAG: hypothetical protein CBC24_09085 [Candidatus Pelagibacter sp. TMED64]|nr:MAG: hypothetical protein CBC24_09370 [Candidatus Pelagibacter sp. TMED64]OUU63379.1 MAG: hypothetical protein CBC24_09085 [Candidatus Pelagibacter sp. TMED64]|tara:strand:+ start:40 stop:540 length:501 start_codon:yes stop_codon:yes gene_type:complete